MALGRFDQLQLWLFLDISGGCQILFLLLFFFFLFRAVLVFFILFLLLLFLLFILLGRSEHERFGLFRFGWTSERNEAKLNSTREIRYD